MVQEGAEDGSKEKGEQVVSEGTSGRMALPSTADGKGADEQVRGLEICYHLQCYV